MQDLAGRAAVVTGAGSGIGRAIARSVAGKGMDVAARAAIRGCSERLLADF